MKYSEYETRKLMAAKLRAAEPKDLRINPLTRRRFFQSTQEPGSEEEVSEYVAEMYNFWVAQILEFERLPEHSEQTYSGGALKIAGVSPLDAHPEVRSALSENRHLLELLNGTFDIVRENLVLAVDQQKKLVEEQQLAQMLLQAIGIEEQTLVGSGPHFLVQDSRRIAKDHIVSGWEALSSLLKLSISTCKVYVYNGKGRFSKLIQGKYHLIVTRLDGKNSSDDA